MVRPWFVLAVEASQLRPVAAEATVAALLLAANLLAYAGERLDLLLYFPFGIGYLIAAAALCAPAAARDLRGLRPVLACDDATFGDLERSMGRYPPLLLWLVTASGLAMAAGLGRSAGVALAPAPWAALLLPSLGARARIREKKLRELGRGRDALSRQPFRPGDPPLPRGYVDLLLYEERVARVSEWPLDAPAMFRFALYLLIPLAGWVGGALVELALSLALD